MAGTIYVALTGMQTRLAQLDRVASDIANESTAGYKGERASTTSVNRPSFDAMLDAAIDTAPTQSKIDFRPGVILPTNRDLDVAVDGKGFFTVQAATGQRYTRNGHFTRSADGTLVTGDGLPVLGDTGPLKVPDGQVVVKPDGTVNVDGAAAGKLKIVDFADYTQLAREDGGRFRAPTDAQTLDKPAGMVRSGALEQANVSIAERIAGLTEVSRGFEALQRSVSLTNEIDVKAIGELSRR
jgi:flagellar basal-body rod protein FlgF